MEDNSLLMIILAFIVGCMCSGMMKQMCGNQTYGSQMVPHRRYNTCNKLIEGSSYDDSVQGGSILDSFIKIYDSDIPEKKIKKNTNFVEKNGNNYYVQYYDSYSSKNLSSTENIKIIKNPGTTCGDDGTYLKLKVKIDDSIIIVYINESSIYSTIRGLIINNSENITYNHYTSLGKVVAIDEDRNIRFVLPEELFIN